MKFKYIFVALLLLALIPASAQPSPGDSGSLVVIVNKSNKLADITQKELQLIFKGAKKRWSAGGRIIPLNLSYGTNTRGDFDKGVLNFTPSESKEYWVQQRIKAQRTPPRALKSSLSVKRFVAKVPAAIGYIPANEVDSSVKVLYTFNSKP